MQDVRRAVARPRRRRGFWELCQMHPLFKLHRFR